MLFVCFVCRHWGHGSRVLGNRWIQNPWHSGPHLLICPSVPSRPISSLFPCSDIIITLLTLALFVHTFFFFTHDVPLVGHLCQMKIYIFPSSIQMPPFLGILPGLPHPALASLVPPEFPEPSGYMSLTPECSVLHAVFMCLPLPPVSRLRQTHTKSLHPYPPCWHRVCFRGGCPEMFIGWMNEITGLA